MALVSSTEMIDRLGKESSTKLSFLPLELECTMADLISDIAIRFRASPSLHVNSRHGEFISPVSLLSSIEQTRKSLSLTLKCAEDSIWLFHNGYVISDEDSRRLRWVDLRCFLSDPTVYHCQRNGLPRSLKEMCSVELDSLRQRTAIKIRSQKPNKDPTVFSTDELELMRIICAQIMLDEREGNIGLALRKAVWRYAVLARNLKNPPQGYVDGIISKVKIYSRSADTGKVRRRTDITRSKPVGGLRVRWSSDKTVPSNITPVASSVQKKGGRDKPIVL